MLPSLSTASDTADLALPESVEEFPGYALGNNWRVQFQDADGLPLNMLSFEVIDFGAISFKEIFQNVKTILATPIWSAALERTLGVDQSIVDLPMDRAAEATITILDALYFWEPRVEVINIQFASDVISGHLTANLQLRIRNVIYGTIQPYAQSNIFKQTPTQVNQSLPPIGEPVLIPGPPGEPGKRGSKWFTGPDDPGVFVSDDVLPGDMYLNTTTGDVFQFSAEAPTFAPFALGRRKK